MPTPKKAAKKKATTSRPRKGGQSGIFDREVKDRSLAELCGAYFEARDPRPASTRKKERDAKSAINNILGRMKTALRDGEVVRVGEYMITNTLRPGGGFKVNAWGPKPVAGVRRAS